MIHRTYQIAGDSSDSLEIFITVALSSATGWALVVNNSSITADRISVYGVVDGPIADAALLHTSDDFFESVQIL